MNDIRVGIAPAVREELDRLEGMIDGAGGEPYVLPAASPTALGGVKQAAAVADAAGEQVTKTEFDALLAALRAVGIMAAN